MGEKDDGLGLGLGLGLSLSLGCGGNLQTSVKINPMQKQPSQMVQNHDKKTTPWNEIFQFPGKLSVFLSSGFYLFFICFPSLIGSTRRSFSRPLSLGDLRIFRVVSMAFAFSFSFWFSFVCR